MRQTSWNTLKFGSLTAVVLASIAMALLLPAQSALAAVGSMSITPSASSLQKGQNTTMTIAINPGTAINAVHVVVHYNAAQLTYVSTSYAGSPFNFQPSAPAVSSSTVSFDQADLSGSVSANSYIASVVFTAKTGSGSSSLTLADSNAANNGTATNPSTGSTQLTFVTPAPPKTAPTPTTPSTPVASPGKAVAPVQVAPNTSTSTPTTRATDDSAAAGNVHGSKHSSGNAPAANGGSAEQLLANGGQSTTAAPAGLTLTGKHISYKSARLTMHSSSPLQVYVLFGANGKLSSATALSGLATDQSVDLDPSLLEPGTTYSYQIVSKSAQGDETRGVVQRFHTRGMAVRVLVLGKNKQPLHSQKVTLHSEPQTVTTDKQGYASFSNVAPGSHQVIYTAGKRSFTQMVSVNNNLTSVNGQTVAPTQNFAVVMDYKPAPSPLPIITGLLAVALLAAAVLQLQRRGRLQPLVVGLAQRFQPVASTVVDTPQVITATSAAPKAPIASHLPATPADHAAFLRPAQAPEPGSVFKPHERHDGPAA